MKFQVKTLLASLWILTFPTLSMAAASHPQGFSGNLGLGFSSSTGTSQALSLNTAGELYWLRGPWSNESNLAYNYARSDSEVSADRLALGNSTRYLFGKNTYAFGSVDYVRNHFDGYYYRVDEYAGLGHYLYPAENMRLALQAGVGAREAHRIGYASEVDPLARLSAKYRWQISKGAKLTEAVDAVLVRSGANTYQSLLALDTPLLGSLGMRFSFLATYNAQVATGYKPFNTLTAVNLVYHF
ncbi:DUF481 domain-containing protein [Candidatus Igneacidithiobacillus taiwanensis]|uniref:DUF481 domain-containing protein n=1 Tax=Candidatus Igneacidithiobacillus taiwanensis TaxID=1945924 RepID=UPI0028A16F65|nr:DUF481 domain-containing protein [Candidatus Igneacidithiobacillus taiwanensis]